MTDSNRLLYVVVFAVCSAAIQATDHDSLADARNAYLAALSDRVPQFHGPDAKDFLVKWERDLLSRASFDPERS